jgi:PQQ-like domain
VSAARRIAIAAGGWCIVGAVAASSAPAGTVPPIAYAPAADGPRVTMVPLGGASGGRAPWKVQVSFRCEGQTVIGALAVRVDRGGRFEAQTKRLVTKADVGSDTDVTMRGRLSDTAAEGTIDAHARAYDNAGTTFECTKDNIGWRADSRSESGAERIESFLPTGADALAVTPEAVFVDEDHGDNPSVVKRLDPQTGKTKWSRRVGDADRVVANAERVWVASGAKGEVLGLDARTGRVVATTSVGPGSFDAIAPGTPQPIAVTADAVWVATAGGLVRLDPSTGQEQARVAVGAAETVVAGPSGVVTAVAAPDAEGRSLASRVVRVDPTTNQAVAETTFDKRSVSFHLAAAADAITLADADEPLVRLDPETLSPLAPTDVVADGGGVVDAAPGTWVSTPDGLVALDASGAPVLRVRGITGEIGAAGDTVWVLDTGARGVVRVRAG